MGLKINLIGQRFGRLKVIQDSGKRTGSKHGDGHVIWGCRCDCGKWVNVIGTNLRYGHTRSCNCLKREQVSTQGKVNIKHGDCKSRLYHTWQGMKRKCYNPHSVNFQHYGARGIRICRKWLNRKTGYLNFKTWALNNGYSPGLSYYRITQKDRRKHFSPDNCQINSRVGWLKI